jgi:uncharacterized protein (TIGR02246 family)
MNTEDQLRELLKTYEKWLNAGDAARSAACYTSDGMFIPQGLPTVRGGAIRDAYAGLFQATRLNVTFTIEELVVASEEIAYALTHSHGTQTVVSTGAEGVESNREMFIFRTENGSWKIARYMFNLPQ